MTPGDLDDLAEAVEPLAARLVGAVHDDGPLEVADVIAQIEAVGPLGLRAVAVVLAAMVDPDRSTADLLRWVQENLFHTDTGDTSPRAWTDRECHRLWMAYRRVGATRGPMERAGYKEWERRRAIYRRGRDWETRAIHLGVKASEALEGGDHAEQLPTGRDRDGT